MSNGIDVWSTLDLKNGFYNVPVAPGAWKMLGIATYTGLYRYFRMPMGVLSAPGHF